MTRFDRILWLTPVFLLRGPAAGAQGAPWTAVLRGSWVQIGPALPGDVVLDSATQIVVAADENSAVHQAAAFLAADVEKISSHRPPIVAAPTAGRAAIHLVTLGHPGIPATLNATTLQGQWESYRIVTSGRDVWLVGSNSRGTAYAAYTLSERLGIDPLYIWTGYTPALHDPLVLKGTNFTQAPPAFRSIAASSTTMKTSSPAPSTQMATRCRPAMSRSIGTSGSSKLRCAFA